VLKFNNFRTKFLIVFKYIKLTSGVAKKRYLFMHLALSQ